MGIHAQGEEVEEIVEVDLPVGLGVGRQRQILAGLLAGDAGRQPLLVDAAGIVLQIVLSLRELRTLFFGDEAGRALAIVRGLRPPLVARGCLHRVDGQRIPGRIFVDTRRAVANPLPPAVHRYPHDKLDLRHFERRGVGMSHEVADELAVIAHLSRTLAVTHASGLHHGTVVSHAVDQGHEAVVEHGELLPPQRLEEGSPVSRICGGGGGSRGATVGLAHRGLHNQGKPHRMKQSPPGVNP